VQLFFTTKFYVAMGLCIVLFLVAFLYSPIYFFAQIGLVVFLSFVAIDYVVLFLVGKPPIGKRVMADRLSNGDNNTIEIQIKNNYAFVINFTIIDELPLQFQKRDGQFYHRLQPQQQKSIVYTLRPIERGEYTFGNIIFYAKTLLGLLSKRSDVPAMITVPVYPSFLQLHKYELLSQTTIQTEYGNKRMRKIGHSMEFEQIKEYINGDDVRSINWKATARKGQLMVNNFNEEKSQQVYCIIDKGRLMKMPFNELTLLDYAINSTLVLSGVCLKKQDKVGLITFANKMSTVLAADRKPIQRENILQQLYNQQTAFLESDFEMLYMQVRNRIKQRSLLILYTNFESLSGLNRQLNYLRSIAKHHLLLVVFFENTELTQLTHLNAQNIEEVYIKTIAEKFAFEKRLIVKELKKHGILSVLTTPENLTVNMVNKYLELKARQAL
jgi:uncharacterized protein (DUF58 family)